MSEKELDEILKEIKQNGRDKIAGADNGVKEEHKSAQLGSEDTKPDVKEERTPDRQYEPADTDDDDKGFVLNETDSSAWTAKKENGAVPTQDNAININDYADRSAVSSKKKKNNSKALIIAIVAIIVAVAVGAGVYFAFVRGNDDKTTDTVKNSTTANTQSGTAAVDTAANPLTGETGYTNHAVNKRPVAVVVENEYSTESVRPQWGLADADIVLEGESEFSTRLLLFWADNSTLPEQVGPTRSARPPFINFSQLFDCIFIHAGLSHSRGNYVGASEVFRQKDVAHVNLLSYSAGGDYFGRDKSRTSTIEHTGYLKGKNTPALLKEKGFRTNINEAKFSVLSFNKEAKPLSSNTAAGITYKWSSRCPKKGTFTYDTASEKFTTTDFDSSYGTAGVKWENLIFLNDQTEYVVKENYKGSGSSETYCDYKLSGGDGIVLSRGTYVEIKWGVTDGKLWLHDAATGDDISLNPGKSYIGYGSSNNGGEFTLS